jgi:hypothetical protein
MRSFIEHVIGFIKKVVRVIKFIFVLFGEALEALSEFVGNWHLYAFLFFVFCNVFFLSFFTETYIIYIYVNNLYKKFDLVWYNMLTGDPLTLVQFPLDNIIIIKFIVAIFLIIIIKTYIKRMNKL